MASVHAADCGSTAFFRLAGAFRLRSQGSIRPFSYRSLTQERERGLFCRSVATFRNRPGHFPAPTGLPGLLRPDFFRRNGLPIRPGSAMQTASRARPLVARAPHAPALRPQSSFSHPPFTDAQIFVPSHAFPPVSPPSARSSPSALPAPGSSCATFPSPSDRLFPKTKARPFMRNLPRGTGRTMSAGGSPERTPPSCGRRARLFSYLW